MQYEVKIPFRNIPDLYKWRVNETPDRPAFSYKKDNQWVDISWKDFFERAKCIASALIHMGFKKREHSCDIFLQQA
jgi:long-chain acyl-CoA synthetase